MKKFEDRRKNKPLMLEDPMAIVEGIKIIKKILGINSAVIGIEENNFETFYLF